MTRKDAERQEAIDTLRTWISPGDTVYTILRHVSRSGMQREIGIVLVKPEGPQHPNFMVGAALGGRIGRRDGLIVSGGGMDMGFHVVYNLGRTLWPDGFGCIGEKCRSNDHSNGDRNRTADTDFAPTDNVRDVGFVLRGSDDKTPEYACGVWGERDTWGKRELKRGPLPSLYLFDDEIDSDDRAPRHWHNDGGYALRHEWL